MHACSLWRPQMMDTGVKSSVSCSWFLYLKVTTVSHLGALGLYKTEVVDLRSMGWPFSLVYAVTVHWADGSGVSPPSSAWPSLSLGSGTGVVCMCLWLGALRLLAPAWTLWVARTESGVELDWTVQCCLLWGTSSGVRCFCGGQAFLKGTRPRGPSMLLTSGNHSSRVPCPKSPGPLDPGLKTPSSSMRLLGYAVIMVPSWTFINPFNRGNWTLWKFLILVFRRLK